MRDHPDAVMLFAAGFGTRMKHLTADRPKPMVEVAGRPLMDHALDLARGIVPRKIVANLHYKPEALTRHLEGSDVQTVLEAPQILDTGGGLRNALPMLGQGPVYTLNTDAIWSGPNPLALLAAAWRPEDMDALLICIPPTAAIGHEGTGDFGIDAQGRLARGAGYIYGGAQIIRTHTLADVDQPAFSLNLVWDEMLARGRVHGLVYPGRWCDVGYPGGIPLAEALLGDRNV